MPDTLTAPQHFGTEDPQERSFNDRLVHGALTALQSRGALPTTTPVDWAGFHAAAERISTTFTVEKSSITTRMARLLYGITATVDPTSVLCLGSAWGNALAWLAAAAPSAHIVGVDINAEATAVAATNFCRADLRADFLIADARNLDTLRGHTFDLVLLDVDDPHTGKGILTELLPTVGTVLAPTAHVLAHDSCYPKFAQDFTAYRSAVSRVLGTHVTVNTEVDRYGLEVSAR